MPIFVVTKSSERIIRLTKWQDACDFGYNKERRRIKPFGLPNVLSRIFLNKRGKSSLSLLRRGRRGHTNKWVCYRDWTGPIRWISSTHFESLATLASSPLCPATIMTIVLSSQVPLYERAIKSNFTLARQTTTPIPRLSERCSSHSIHNRHTPTRTEQCTNIFFLMLAIPKCLTHIQIYNDVSVKHNRTFIMFIIVLGLQ